MFNDEDLADVDFKVDITGRAGMTKATDLLVQDLWVIDYAGCGAKELCGSARRPFTYGGR